MRNSGVISADETFSARLHVVGFSDSDSDSNITHRLIYLHGLDRPHIEAALGVKVFDAAAKQEYQSPATVPGIAAIDFLGVNCLMRVTPAWLSRKKQKHYSQALADGEEEIARQILGTWPDAQMHSTHFNVGQNQAGEAQFVSASKLCRPNGLNHFVGRNLLAFTVGPGHDRCFRTDAISGVIVVASKLNLIPNLDL